MLSYSLERKNKPISYFTHKTEIFSEKKDIKNRKIYEKDCNKPFQEQFQVNVVDRKSKATQTVLTSSRQSHSNSYVLEGWAPEHQRWPWISLCPFCQITEPFIIRNLHHICPLGNNQVTSYLSPGLTSNPIYLVFIQGMFSKRQLSLAILWRKKIHPSEKWQTDCAQVSWF